MNQEVAAVSHLGTEIDKHLKKSEPIPDEITLKVIKKAMLKYQDTNRFLLDGFPTSLEQAKAFERDIAELGFCLFFDSSAEACDAQTKAVVDFYGPIGKLRACKADQGADDVFAEARRYFSSRF